MTSFRNFEHFSLPTSLIKQKKRNWARNYMWDFYDFMIKFFHSLTYPKTWGRGPKRLKNTWNWSFLIWKNGPKLGKNHQKWSFFIPLNTPPCWSWSQSKLNLIGHATTCDSLIISCNSNIRDSFTRPKT